MKKTIILLAVTILLSNCKSFDASLLNPTGQPFNPKLPAMEKIVENNMVAIISPNGQIVGANPQDVNTLFDREVSEIMTNPYDTKRGYLVLKVSRISDKAHMGGYLFGVMLLSVPNLLGLPFFSAKSSVEVQVDVLDQNRKLIGSYRASATKKIRTTYYSNNYNFYNTQRVAFLESVKEGLKEVKIKMQPDITRLTSELTK